MSDALSNVNLLTLAAAAHKTVQQQLPEDEVTELFERWRPALLKYISTFGLCQHDSEEIVQEVFLLLFSHLQRNKARTNLRGWLFRVAHNLALKKRTSARKETGAAGNIGDLVHPALNPEEELACSERHRRLSSILGALPEQDRRCLYLRAEGLRYREIAEVLGISLGSIAASLERSLARFQRADQR